ncbi:hypothetical protein [Neobacillus sp. PS3-40]|uniref:hypothetical protein n=1 Tax=Neobacillus sp. PS3-40 TaxID=3070679 RepID=UPI0027E02656|nr:hypothetical protein [Neobacillus sp. PS3-40]WML42613.1 hypothetical protein RCG20_12105 [Neobacillus sp. PS3-40]
MKSVWGNSPYTAFYFNQSSLTQIYPDNICVDYRYYPIITHSFIAKNNMSAHSNKGDGRVEMAQNDSFNDTRTPR